MYFHIPDQGNQQLWRTEIYLVE